MRLKEVKERSGWHDTVGIDGGMTAVVVLLDMLHVHRCGDARPLIQLAGKGPQGRVIHQAPEIALEVAVVNRVEADQRSE